jgi:hypothetical protein
MTGGYIDKYEVWPALEALLQFTQSSLLGCYLTKEILYSGCPGHLDTFAEMHIEAYSESLSIDIYQVVPISQPVPSPQDGLVELFQGVVCEVRVQATLASDHANQQPHTALQ